MKLSTTILALTCASTSAAFAPHASSSTSSSTARKPTMIKGYLDDLSQDLYKEDATPDVQADSREENVMSKDQVDRFGPGNLNDFVEFNEFDGGDGQMGVAGDGKGSGLDKSDFDTGELAQSMNKSRMRSARNAWGTTSTGYAEKLQTEGMDVARAQQLENWHNQQEIKKKKDAQRDQAAAFETVESSAEEDWRTLAKFGIERNTESNLDEEFGAVSVEGAEDMGTIALSTRVSSTGYQEVPLKNPYMGFADFRASIMQNSASAWTVTPGEGSISKKEPTVFSVKFKPEGIGTFEGKLIIQTEDFKKVWHLIGTTG